MHANANPQEAQALNAAHFARACFLTADAGFTAEGHTAAALCAGARHFAPLITATQLLSHLHGRTPLEYYIKTGNQHRAAWLLDRCGAQALAWDPPPAHQHEQPRWRHALFDRPPYSDEIIFCEELWRQWPVFPAPQGHALTRAMLIERVGGAPLEGFVMPPRLPSNNQGFGRMRILGPLAAWRAHNPDAKVAFLYGRTDLRDADFAHLAGIKAVSMPFCSHGGLTDAAFAHLRGIHTLHMYNCNQTTITDAAFAHLRGIHTLEMHGSNQATITDAAFVHLRGIHTLDMSGCRPAAIATAQALGLPVQE